MEKIYAKTLNPESYEYECYDIRNDDGNEVYLDGEKNYFDVDNKGYLAKIKKLINEYSDYELQVYHNGSIMDCLNYYLPKKENGKRLSPRETHQLKQALELEKNNKEIICECLSIITGKIYRHKGLRGYCQGDYIEAYYPVEDRIMQYLDYVEAWFFGTGTEVMVHEEENTVNGPEDICGWTFYTTSYKAEDLKKEIKQQCGFKEDEEVEVKLWLFDRVQVIHKSVYKEAE